MSLNLIMKGRLSQAGRRSPPTQCQMGLPYEAECVICDQTISYFKVRIKRSHRALSYVSGLTTSQAKKAHDIVGVLIEKRLTTSWAQVDSILLLWEAVWKKKIKNLNGGVQQYA